MHKTIFHIDESSKWQLTLKNALNLHLELIEVEHHIIILANSEAVKEYINKSSINDLMNDLRDKNITFKACNNALKAFNINKEQLINYVEVVSAGVLELSDKQHAGYAYIKP